MPDRNRDHTPETLEDALGRVSGIPRAEMRAIWEKVKENHARLDGCVGPHDFVATTEVGNVPRRYTCTRCQGEVDAVNYSWYQTGLAHGRMDRRS